MTILWKMVFEYFSHRIRFGHWTYPVAVDDPDAKYACYNRSCNFALLKFPALT